ncbi:MAG: hypothetical protein L0271_12605 [Gemmatimonadetes bacterium]|nr:hypothetical protein [Gemmatimonadota bacterium]
MARVTSRSLLGPLGVIALLFAVLLDRLAMLSSVPFGGFMALLYTAGVVLVIVDLVRDAWHASRTGAQAKLPGVAAALAAVVSLSVIVLGAAVVLRSEPAEGGETTSHTAPDDWSAMSASELVVASIIGAVAGNGAAAALDALERAAESDPRIHEAGHHHAHSIGRLAMSAAGNDPGVIADCRQLFQSGCFHGALEQYVMHLDSMDAAGLRVACADLRDGRLPRAAALECAHGVGHGLVATLDHDLVAALNRCDTLPGDEPGWCYSGAFMENVANVAAEWTARPAGHPEHARADDPYFPCSVVAARYQHACWGYQSIILMLNNGRDYAATLRACDGAPAEWVARCYEGFGIQISGQEPDDDVIVERCSLTDRPVLAGRCIMGAGEYFTAVTWQPVRAFELCGRAPGASAGECFRRIGRRMAEIHPNEADARAACRLAGSLEHAATCLAGVAAGSRSARRTPFGTGVDR